MMKSFRINGFLFEFEKIPYTYGVGIVWLSGEISIIVFNFTFTLKY